MCLKFLTKYFNRLPYPEEAKGNGQGVNVEAVREEWITNYFVANPERWRTTKIDLKGDIAACAQAYSGDNRIEVQSAWLNPGVLAHEMAHISYFGLSDEAKGTFDRKWKDYSKTGYMSRLWARIKNDSSIEAHAEIYRFLGCWMPQDLYVYYPDLVRV